MCKNGEVSKLEGFLLILDLECDLTSEQKPLNSCTMFKVSGISNGKLFLYLNNELKNSNLLSEANLTIVKVESTLYQTLFK